MSLLTGFSPLINERSRVLILGSMPGVASLSKHQYYGHERNAFWPIMEELFLISRELDYVTRCEALLQKRVAVWDVLKACQRPGSLDSSIQKGSEQINDFQDLFSGYSQIRAIFFNGGTAERLYHRHVRNLGPDEKTAMQFFRLPSTSPAYASMSFENKYKQWRRITDFLEE